MNLGIIAQIIDDFLHSILLEKGINYLKSILDLKVFLNVNCSPNNSLDVIIRFKTFT